MSPVFKFRCPSCNAAGVVNEGHLSLPRRHEFCGSGRLNKQLWYRFSCPRGNQHVIRPPIDQPERKTVTEEEYRRLRDPLEERYAACNRHMQQSRVPEVRWAYKKLAQEQLAAIDKVKRQYVYDQQEEKLFEDVTVETWSGLSYTAKGVAEAPEPQPKPDDQVDPLIATFDRRIAEWVEVEKRMEAVFQADRDEEAAVAQRLEKPPKAKDPALEPLWNTLCQAAEIGVELIPVIVVVIFLMLAGHALSIII